VSDCQSTITINILALFLFADPLYFSSHINLQVVQKAGYWPLWPIVAKVVLQHSKYGSSLNNNFIKNLLPTTEVKEF